MSRTIEFRYHYNAGETWATGSLGVGNGRFEFVCSYLFSDPLEDLLRAVYQVVPGLAPFPRQKIAFVMLDEPTEYRWELERSDENDLLITIYAEQTDSEVRLVFKEECPLAEFLAAIIRCIGNNPALRSNERIDQFYEPLLSVQ